MEKYRLTNDTIEFEGRTLYRIEALKDFDTVKAGNLGGFIESTNNLAQSGTSWVFDNAKVFGNAFVRDDAKVFDNAKIFDNAALFDNAHVLNDAQVFGKAVLNDNVRVLGNAKIFGNTSLEDNVLVQGNVEVYEQAWVNGNVKIYDNAKIFGSALVQGYVKIYGNVQIFECASVGDKVVLCGNVKAHNCARLLGCTEFKGDAELQSEKDYIVFKNWWSSGRYFTWTRSNNMWKVGCFYGTGEELIKKAYNDSEISGREYERVVRYVESILNDNYENKED